MANILTEEDKKNQENQSQSVNQTEGLTGVSSAGSVGNNPSTPNVQPKGSGRFTNLQRYLDANQKAGDNLTSGIRDKGDKYLGSVREGIESAKGVQQGIVDEKTRLAQSGQYAQQIQNDAVGAAQNNLDPITQLRLGQNQANQLQGQGTQAVTNLQQNINPLQRFGENLGTESGRFQVLQDVYGGSYRPDYNMGQRRLDQLFLQAAPDNELNQLQSDIGSTVGEAGKSLQSLQGDLGTGIGQIRSGAQQARQDILGAIGDFNPDQSGAFGQLYSDFSTEQSAREQELQNYLDIARAQFGAGQLNQNVADMLGFTGTENVSDLDLADYARKNINLGDTDVTMADVLNRSDLQTRLNALAQLAGTDVSSYDLGEEAGQDLSFDANKFRSDAQSQRDTYEDRFFDKNIYELLGKQFFADRGQDVIANNFQNYIDQNQSIGDYVGGYTQAYSPNQGIYVSPLYGQAADPTSRQQLQIAADAIAANPYAYFRTDPARFPQLLSLFDTQRNRQFGVGDIANDLEGGGHFNVT